MHQMRGQGGLPRTASAALEQGERQCHSGQQESGHGRDGSLSDPAHALQLENPRPTEPGEQQRRDSQDGEGIGDRL